MSTWQEITKHVFEWCNLYLVLPLGAGAFGVAIWQITDAKNAANQAKTAAEAAKGAAENARSQFKTMSVTVLLPQLRNLEEAMEHAIHDKSLKLLMHLVHDWLWHATACRQYLDESNKAEAQAMTDIQKSVVASTALKQRFFAFDEATDWAKETTQMRKTMANVTANLGALSAQQTVRGA